MITELLKTVSQDDIISVKSDEDKDDEDDSDDSDSVHSTQVNVKVKGPDQNLDKVFKASFKSLLHFLWACSFSVLKSKFGQTVTPILNKKSILSKVAMIHKVTLSSTEVSATESNNSFSMADTVSAAIKAGIAASASLALSSSIKLSEEELDLKSCSKGFNKLSD